MRKTHVNIVDLVEWGRGTDSSNRTHVEAFRSKGELVEYTRSSGKIFPISSVENSEGNRNVVLRHLLRRIIE